MTREFKDSKEEAVDSPLSIHTGTDAPGADSDDELELKGATQQALLKKANEEMEEKNTADQKVFQNLLKSLLKKQKEDEEFKLEPELTEAFNNPAIKNGFDQLRNSLPPGLNFDDLNTKFKCISEDKAVYQSDDKKSDKSVSPGILVCTNADSQPMEFIDQKKQTTFGSVINNAREKWGLGKIKLTGYFVDGQPTLVYHANSGDNKSAVRILERRVLDDVIKALLDEGYPSVMLLAQTHEPEYKVTPDKKKLEAKDGHMVLSDDLFGFFGDFNRHDISQSALSEEVVYKSRGAYDKTGKFLGFDAFNCPQQDKDARPDWAASMLILEATRPDPDNKERKSNIERLEQKKTPLIQKVLNYITEFTDFFGYRPVKLETENMIWLVASDTSRSKQKAFKNPHDVYHDNDRDLNKLNAFKEDGNLKPEVEKARIDATSQFYIQAANHFIRVKQTHTPEQKERLDDLRNALNGQRLPLSITSFNYFKNTEAGNKFIIALTELIKTQINQPVAESFVQPEEKAGIVSLGVAWQAALNKWSNPEYISSSRYLTDLKKYLKIPTDKKHPSEMNAKELRALSAEPTDGGGFDPIKKIFAEFGLELQGGYSSHNGSSNETNESLGFHQLFAKSMLAVKALFLNKPVFMAVTEGADSERSPQELKNQNNIPPSKSFPQMINDIVNILKLCNKISPKNVKDLGSAPASIELQPKPQPKPLRPPVKATQIATKNGPTLILRYVDRLGEIDRLHKDPTRIYDEVDPRKFKDWSPVDKSEYLLSHGYAMKAAALFSPKWTVINGVNGINTDDLLTQERNDVLFDIGHAILQYQDLKKVYALRVANKVDKDINWAKIKTNMDQLATQVNTFCDVLKKRNGWETFRACLLAAAAILVFAATVALFTFAFGGIPILSGLLLASTQLWVNPLVAVVGMLGLVATGGIGYAYKHGFWRSKPKPELTECSELVKKNFNTYHHEFMLWDSQKDLVKASQREIKEDENIQLLIPLKHT